MGANGLGMHAPLGGTWLLPSNGGHILQAMHIWLDTSFAFFKYHKESSKALEVVGMVDLHVGWGPLGLACMPH
jgi:hypothetical protein